MNATAALLPPMGNTGVEQRDGSQSVRPDWLHGTCPIERYDGQVSERWSVERLAITLREFFPGSTGARHRGNRHFAEALRHREFALFWEGVGDTRGRVYVEVRGEGWADLAEADALELLRYLTVAHRFKASRFDLALDVPGLTADAIETRLNAADYRSRAREIATHRTLKGARRGGTVEFGSRASDRFLRCYDYRGPLRIEVELKRAFASGAVTEVIGAREFRPTWASNVRAVVEFPGWAEWEAATC